MGKTWTDEISFDLSDATFETAPVLPGPFLTIVPPIPAPIHQDIERIDAAGAARAISDAATAKSLGMPVRDTVYEIGTVVNSIGVANLRASRADWEASPPLPELARTFSDQIANERRADRLVDAPTVAMTVAGKLRADGIDHAVTSRAFDGLASHVTPGGGSYLRACPPELRALNVNHWLANATTVDARASRASKCQVVRPRQLTLRTRESTIGSGREVYAVTGPKYAAFDADKVAREAAAGIGGDARGTIAYDGYRMTMDAMFHTNIEPEHAVAGEYFKGTIRIQAADDGTGAIKVKLGLWRNLCRNLIIVDFDTVLVGSRRHVGASSMEADVRDLMTSASERIGLMVGKWSEASTENVLSRYDLTDVDQVFRGLVLNDCVKATGVKPDEMVKRLHTAWEREPGYSKTAILNAITRAAHESTWSTWSDSEDLESAAGELLYQPVWTLDYSERTAEQLLA